MAQIEDTIDFPFFAFIILVNLVQLWDIISGFWGTKPGHLTNNTSAEFQTLFGCIPESFRANAWLRLKIQLYFIFSLVISLIL